MSSSPNQKHIIQAILTNPKLNEEEKSELVTEFIEEIRNEYPDLKNHATKFDIQKLEKEIEQMKIEAENNKTELKRDIEFLSLETKKEMEKLKLELQKEIQESKMELQKEMQENKIELQKEIQENKMELQKEMQENKIELQKEIENTKFTMLKWSFIFWVTQFGAIITLGYKLIK